MATKSKKVAKPVQIGDELGRTILYVVPLSVDGGRGFGNFVLVHPQFFNEYERVLFRHTCSNINYAMEDLQYPNRTDFLNEVFGVDGWVFKSCIIEEDGDVKPRFLELANINPIIDTNIILQKFNEYRERGKHL